MAHPAAGAGAGGKEALAGQGPPRLRLAGVDEDAPRVVGALFEFPNTVDNRVIRLVAVQVRAGLQGMAVVHRGCSWRDPCRSRLVRSKQPACLGGRAWAPCAAGSTYDGSAQMPLQVFFVSLFLAIFSYKKEQSWHWVAVGLLTDFCLRFYVRGGGAGQGWQLLLAAGARCLRA